MADQAEMLRRLVRREAQRETPAGRFAASAKSRLARVWAVTGPSGAGATHVAEMLAIGLEKQASPVALIHPIDFDEIDSLCENAEVAIVDTGEFGERTSVSLLAADEVICVCTPEDDGVTGAYAVIKQLLRAGSAPPLHLAVNRAVSFEQGMNVWRRLQTTASRFLGVDLAWLGALPCSNRFVRRAACALSDDEAAAIEAMSLRVLGRHRSAPLTRRNLTIHRDR